jgi:hypothetical protein
MSLDCRSIPPKIGQLYSGIIGTDRRDVFFKLCKLDHLYHNRTSEQLSPRTPLAIFTRRSHQCLARTFTAINAEGLQGRITGDYRDRRDVF